MTIHRIYLSVCTLINYRKVYFKDILHKTKQISNNKMLNTNFSAKKMNLNSRNSE